MNLKYLSVKEALDQKKSLLAKPTSIKGLLIVGKPFSYLVEDINLEFENIIQPAILIPEKKIAQSLEERISPRVGGQTMVIF